MNAASYVYSSSTAKLHGTKWILKWLRMLFSAFGAIIFFPYIRIGSYRDVLRWLLVVPFYSLALTISYRCGK